MRLWLILAVAMCATDVALASTVVFVDAGATESPHDGSDWAHAYLQLHEALASAAPGTTIRVAAGEYLPDTSGLADPRAAVFALASSVAIEGGYAGDGAANPNARNPTIHETIFSGDIGAANISDDNCYHVVLAVNVDASAVLDGVTIFGGTADGAGSQRQGGGMFVSGDGPVVRGCTFRDNTAEFGGAVFTTSASPTFANTTFEDNVATSSGGAIYNFNSLGQVGPTISNCRFDENSAESSGGALRHYDGEITVVGCVFNFNHARYGGGAVANGGQGSPRFERCVFDHNRTDTLFAIHNCFGGAMHNTDNSQPTLVSCAFVGNAAYASLPGISYGGALAQSGSAAPKLVHCTMVDNYANICNGLHNADSSSPSVVGSILWNGGDEILNAGSATIAVIYSAITGSWPGTGNIMDDPQLVNGRLQPGSPCINAGDPSGDMDDDIDLDGHARVLCSRVDMGAYEFGNGDSDCDQTVDESEFPNWAACVTGPDLGPYGGGCAAFDYEFDGDVDLTDFGRFQQQLGEN